MKKVLSFVAVAAAMLVAGNANAQLSVNAGYMSTAFNASTEYTLANTVTKHDTSISMGGFYVGGSYNVELMGGLGVAPGIYFNYAGKKEVKTNNIPLIGEVTTTSTTKMMNINIPILIDYKLTFGDDFAIFAFVGPDIVFGINANSKVVTKSGSTENTYENDLYKKEDGENAVDMTRLDLGLMVGAGLQFNNFRLEAGYELGLLNRAGEKEYTDSFGGKTTNNNSFNRFFVGVGYAF